MPSDRLFQPEELERFLREVDRQLGSPAKIIVIGGAAIGMLYSSEHSTTDIDVLGTPGRELSDAIERAKSVTGLAVPVSQVTIAEPPYDFEDRLQRYALEGLTRLEIWVPERHDLALMKTARGETPDLDAIVAIHRRQPLDLEVLIKRALDMRSTVMGPWSMFRLKFLAMIEAVFGSAVEEQVDKRFPSK